MNRIKFIVLSAFFFFNIVGITAQNDAETAALPAITIDGSKNTAYTFYYKNTHVWLEYQTKENAYIIDPTWSDDYPVSAQARQQFKMSPAYGKRSFFITYEEDKIIFHGHQDHNHSTYTVNQAEIWLF